MHLSWARRTKDYGYAADLTVTSGTRARAAGRGGQLGPGPGRALHCKRPGQCRSCTRAGDPDPLPARHRTRERAVIRTRAA